MKRRSRSRTAAGQDEEEPQDGLSFVEEERQ